MNSGVIRVIRVVRVIGVPVNAYGVGITGRSTCKKIEIVEV